MVNALIQDLLETRFLYRQNAAMRHGVPVPPQRTYTNIATTIHDEPTRQQQSAEPAPTPQSPQPGSPPSSQQPSQQPASPPPPPPQQHVWIPQPPPSPQGSGRSSNLLPIALALLAAPLAGIAGLAAGHLFTKGPQVPTVPDRPPVTQDPGEPLLDFLERRGYSSPYPETLRPLSELP